MKKITVAFDCDGTLIKTGYNDLRDMCEDDINKIIVDLLKILSSFKNTKIIVWSGQGKEWAKGVCEFIGITDFVDGYYSKNHLGKDENGKHIFKPDIIPTICIDDIQDCNLGLINLIVKEK